MFDYLRDLTRSAEEKRQDALSAYLDGRLPAAEARRVEAELAENEALRAQLAEMRLWQQQLRALPSRRVPRNFTLDPALYGKPRRQPLGQAYPALRTATAMAAIMFAIALVALLGGVSTTSLPEAVPVAMQSVPAEEAADTAAEMEMAPVAEMEMAEDTAVAESAPAAAIVEEPTAEALPQEETLRAKPEGTPRALDEFVDPAAVPGVGGEAPPAFEQQGTPFGLMAPEDEPVPEGERSAADALPVESAPEPAQPAEAQEVALANTLLITTLVLGGLLLVLLFLLLLARRQR